tara:strand:+ start:873 stop:1568 length:696 start_codon:yes stop_codon:yes gene_type:complete
MILQGINELIGGQRMKKQGQRDFNRLQKQRQDFLPRISRTAQEDKINPYDASMVQRMREGQLQRDINLMSTAGRNPLAAAKLSSQNTADARQRDLDLLGFIDQKRTKARDTYRSEELRVQDQLFQDFLGRENRALDTIQQGRERIAGGFGALDSAITSAVTMGIDAKTAKEVASINSGGTGEFTSPSVASSTSPMVTSSTAGGYSSLNTGGPGVQYAANQDGVAYANIFGN